MVKFKTMQQIVGGFLLFTILALVFAIFYMVKEKRYFESKSHYYSYLERGDGLSPNTPVILKGINIGYLDEIEINEENKIVINFSVFPEYKRFFRGKTYIKIGSVSLLGGKMIEVMNDNSGEEIPSWSRIFTENDPEMKKIIEENKKLQNQDDANAKIASILLNVDEITGNLKIITRDIKEQKGKLNAALSNVNNITSNVAHITGEIKETTPAIKKSILDTQSTVENVDEMVKGIRKNSLMQLFGVNQKEENVKTEMSWDPRENK